MGIIKRNEKKVMRLLRRGVPIGRIAKAIGCAPGSLYFFARGNGVKLRRSGRRGALEAKKKRVIKRWRAGIPSAEIAKEFGCTVASIFAFAKRHHLPKRNRAPRGGIDQERRADPRNRKRILLWRMHGLSGSAIARKLRLPYHTVNAVLHEERLSLPGRSQRRRILKRINAAIGKRRVDRAKLARRIGFRLPPSLLFERGMALMKHLPKLSKTLKLRYRDLLKSGH